MHSSSFKLQDTSGSAPASYARSLVFPPPTSAFWGRRRTAPGTLVSRSRKQYMPTQDTVGDVGRLDRRKVALPGGCSSSGSGRASLPGGNFAKRAIQGAKPNPPCSEGRAPISADVDFERASHFENIRFDLPCACPLDRLGGGTTKRRTALGSRHPMGPRVSERRDDHAQHMFVYDDGWQGS